MLPHWGCVYCSSVVFVHSVGFRRLRFSSDANIVRLTNARIIIIIIILGISLLGDPNILSVLVCLASVCIIIHILRQCVIVVRFYP